MKSGVFILSGTFFGLNTALRGLFAQQKGINTTAHNVANANTPGYSRQQVILETSSPFPVPSLNKPGGAGQLGTGVNVAEIRRVRDAFLDHQLRAENGSLGRFEEQWKTLSQVETIFMEPTETGLSTILDQFWSAWEDLSNNAENSPIRTTLKELSKTLADTFNHLNSQLNTIINDINEITSIRLQEINTYAEQIANLNSQIAAIQIAGDQPNDLKDRRDALMDELSKLVDFSYKEDLSGVVTIELNGVPLVGKNEDGSFCHKLGFLNDNPLTIYCLNDSDMSATEISVSNGQLRGLSDARDLVESYLGNLNSYARTMADEINQLHQEGYDLNGNPGEDFFIVEPDNAAATIKLNSAIDNDVSLIAASSSSDSTKVGNGDNALKIYQLSRQVFDSGDLNGTSLNNYYKDFVARLGVAANTAKRNEANQQVLVEQLADRKESISGVSNDEEMANLIQYQRAYEAAAKIISVLDEMLYTIIHDLKR